MIIKFQIVKSVVIGAVKRATYLKAKVDSAADEKAIKLGFNEAAGDDDANDDSTAAASMEHAAVGKLCCLHYYPLILISVSQHLSTLKTHPPKKSYCF